MLSFGIVRDIIVDHVRKFNLIRETQHGFVKKLVFNQLV